MTVSDVTGTNGATLNSASVNAGFLIGDVSRDGTVNVGDTVQMKNHAGQTLGNSNFWFDVNADGGLDVGDTVVVRSKSGNYLP